MLNLIKILDGDRAVRTDRQEMLRALAVTYDDVSLLDLSIISGISNTDYLAKLVAGCAPLLQTSDQDDVNGLVLFSDPELKRGLLEQSDRLLNLSRGSGSVTVDRVGVRRQHGEVAWRCYNSVLAAFRDLETDLEVAEASQQPDRGTDGRIASTDVLATRTKKATTTT